MRAILMALALLAAPATALAGAPISKTQVRALPPAEATKRVTDQLSDILVLRQAAPTGRTPTRPLRDLDFTTVPRATWAPGVCARDAVIVTFEPVDSPAHGPDTLVRASSVSARTTYHLLGPPKSGDAYYDAVPPAEARKACAELAGAGDALFFNAPTAEVALSGAWWLTQLARQASAPAPDFTLNCTFLVGAARTCVALASDLSVADIASVEPCPEDRQDGHPLACWAITVWLAEGPYDLRVLVTPGRDSKLARVQINEQVHTADVGVD